MRMYDREGKLVDRDKWAELLVVGGEEYKRVALDVEGDKKVSTVWIGIDYSSGDGPPMIFETMVFSGTESVYVDRYSTLEDAQAGHEKVLDAVKSGAIELHPYCNTCAGRCGHDSG